MAHGVRQTLLLWYDMSKKEVSVFYWSRSVGLRIIIRDAHLSPSPVGATSRVMAFYYWSATPGAPPSLSPSPSLPERIPPG